MSVDIRQDGKTRSLDARYPEMTPWSELLNDFVSLLEAAGYCGVRDRISVEDSPFADAWQGAFHDAKSEEDSKQMSFNFDED